MKLALTLLAFSFCLYAQSWTTVCNGETMGAGSCEAGADWPHARGFMYGKLPIEPVEGSLLYYGASLTIHTDNESIYSSEFWNYTASTRTMAFRLDNGATSISAGSGNTRCAQEGSPASTYNPVLGHPQGYWDVDPVHGNILQTWQLCGGQFPGYTYLINTTTNMADSPIAKAPYGTGDGTLNATANNYQNIAWLGSVALQCCDSGGSTRKYVEWNGSVWTDVTAMVTGADMMACSMSADCPPAPLTAFALLWDRGTTGWVYGGCNGTTPGNSDSNPCNGDPQNDLYRYNSSTRVFTKMAPVGDVKPPSTFSSFPFAAYDTDRSRILVYAGNNDLWSYTIATNTWAQLTVGGNGPDFGDPMEDDTLANHSDGNQAAYDAASHRFVVIYPFPGVGQNGTPAIMDVTFAPAGSKLGPVKISGATKIH